MKTPSNYAPRMPASPKKAARADARKDGRVARQFMVSVVAETVSALKDVP